MGMSRKILQQYLTDNGLEGEYNARLAEEKSKAVEQGMDRKAAASAAYRVLYDEFTKRIEQSAAVTDADLVDPDVFTGKDATHAASVMWCADNLLIDGLTPGDAPSPMAWSLLQWARQNQNRGRIKPMESLGNRAV